MRKWRKYAAIGLATVFMISSTVSSFAQTSVDGIVSVKTVDNDVVISTTANSPYSVEDLSSGLDVSAGQAGASMNVNKIEIDTTDLSNWYVFDHYDTAAYRDETAWENATGYNKQLRPYFPWAEMQNPTDQTNAITIEDLMENSSHAYTWGNVYRLKEHIWANSEDGLAYMNFYGYGQPQYSDFLFYPASSSGTKKVKYTIHAEDVRVHSMSSAGFLFNCGIVNGKLVGYAMIFEYKDSTNGVGNSTPADAIKTVTIYKIDQSAMTNAGSKTPIEQLHAAGGGNSGTKPVLESYGFSKIKQVDLSGLEFSGKYDISDIELEITKNTFKAVMTPKGSSVTTADQPKILFDMQSYDPSVSGNYIAPTDFSDSGYGGIGPIVNYMPHACQYTSSYRYSGLEMSISNTKSVLDGLASTDYIQNKDIKDDTVAAQKSNKYYVLIGDNSKGEEGYKDYFSRTYDALFLEMLKKEGIILLTNLNITHPEGDLNGTDYSLEDYLGAGNVIQLQGSNLADLKTEIAGYVGTATFSKDNAQAATDALGAEGTNRNTPFANAIVTYKGYQVDVINGTKIPTGGIALKVDDSLSINTSGEPTVTLRRPDGGNINIVNKTIQVLNTWPAGVYTVTTEYEGGISDISTFRISNTCHDCYFNDTTKEWGTDQDQLSLTGGTVGVNVVQDGSDYITKLYPDEGYTLPETVLVYVDANGDQELQDSEQLGTSQYTYDSTTGELVVKKESIAGDIYIYADTGKVECELVNVTSNAKDVCSYYDAYRVDFTADEGYEVPEKIWLEMDDEEYEFADANTPVTIGKGTIKYSQGRLEISSNVLDGDLIIKAGVGSYVMKYNLTNVDCDNMPETIGFYEPYNAKLSVAKGYTLSDNVQVQMGDETLTKGYTYDSNTGELKIAKKIVKGPVKITASATLDQYGVTFDTTNILYEGNEHANVENAYTATLTPVTGYHMPEAVTVKVGGKTLSGGYSYNKDTGVVTLKKGTVTGDVVIEAAATVDTYAVLYNLEDLSAKGNDSVTFGETYTGKLTADKNFSLPAKIIVSCKNKKLAAGTDYIYNQKTGDLQIKPSAIKGTIVVSAVADVVTKTEQPKPNTDKLTIVKPTYEDSKDGKIYGVSMLMEYSVDGGKTWRKCTTTKITGLGAGTVRIRFYETRKKKSSAIAEVVLESKTAQYYIPTISMSKKMGFKQKFQLRLANVKGATVKYSSTNTKVAKVNKKGIISTKKKSGKANIVVSILKGKHIVQYVVNVKVAKKTGRNYSLAKFSTKYKSPTIAIYKRVVKGKKWKINLKYTKGSKLTFTSSNKKVATISKKGVVKGIKPGKATIKVKVKRKDVTDQYYVVVRVTYKDASAKVPYLKILK